VLDVRVERCELGRGLCRVWSRSARASPVLDVY
jgi:hypothetical protein